MEDEAIIALYWNRSEQAITETAAKYGGFCRGIANAILSDPEDAEEALNDTLLPTIERREAPVDLSRGEE